MKRHVFLLVFGLLSLSAVAQGKIMMLKDTATYQVSQSALNKKFTPLTDVFRSNSAGAFEAMRERMKQLEAFLKKRNDIPQKGFSLLAYEYYQPNGIPAYAILRPDRNLPDSVLAPMIKCFNDFYSTTPYPATGNVAFRVTTMMQYGKSVSTPRTVRRGAGIISTLEAARKTTRPDTVTMLAFNQLDLTSVPEIVYRFPKLEELDLSNNALHELPARLTADIPTLKRLSVLRNVIPNDSVFITRNKHLRSLNLQGNKLTQIPVSVRQNRRLESLWMGNNKLNDLADADVKTLRRMRRLTDLNLYNAGLTKLPATIGKLKHVKVLDLYYNKFIQLPPQLGRMKRLEQLAVAHNELRGLPVSLTKLRRLQVLYAHHNHLSQLPDEFKRFQNLRVLDLGYNWYGIAPDVLGSLSTLEELSLNNNNLQTFPSMLLSLRKLKKLYLGSNPIFGQEAMNSPYASLIKQLEANNTQVTY
ncbi:hypothetical protein GCM10028805_24980 [Spirosoma harenae]